MTTLAPDSSDLQRAGVGGWRQPHYGELLQLQPPLGFLEVHSGIFLPPVGPPCPCWSRDAPTTPSACMASVLSLGSASGLDPWHLDQLARLVKHIDPVRVSDHASFARGSFKGTTVHASDLLPIPFSTEALNVLCANVQQVQDRLQRRFLVENLSSYLNWQPDPNEPALQEPDFLTALARRTGCGLLIDVNNIYVNALNAQINGEPGDPVQHCLRWLDGIAPADVGEIHLAGHCRVQPVPGDEALGEIVIDDHGSRVCDEVWQIYSHAIARFGAVPTLIEWDTDIPTLDVLLAEAAQAQAVLSATREVTS